MFCYKRHILHVETQCLLKSSGPLARLPDTEQHQPPLSSARQQFIFPGQDKVGESGLSELLERDIYFVLSAQQPFLKGRHNLSVGELLRYLYRSAVSLPIISLKYHEIVVEHI